VILPALVSISACSPPSTHTDSVARAGDTSGSSRTPPAPGAPWPRGGQDIPDDAVAEVEWHISGTPFGRPVLVDGTLIVGTIDRKDHLGISGMDPEDGHTLWHAAQSPGFTPPGVGLAPTAAHRRGGGDLVGYLEPGSNTRLLARVVAADPRSGKVSARTEAMYVTSAPQDCQDGIDLCFSGAPLDGDQVHEYRLRLADGRLVPANSGAPPGSRPLSTTHGLIGLGVRPDVLARTDGGRMLWMLPAEKVFGKGATSDNGANFGYDSATDAFIGSVGAPRTGRRGQDFPFSENLASNVTAAIDARTGRVKWVAKGTRYDCWESFYGTGLVEEGRPLETPVRCRGTGRVTYTGQDKPAVLSHANITVEGFDPRTGRTTWSVPLGLPTLDLGGLIDSATLSRHRVAVFGTRIGRALLDLRTGKHQDLKDRELAYACWRRTDVQYFLPYTLGGPGESTRTRYGAGGTLQACTEDGYDRDDAPPLSAIALGGLTLDRSVITAEPNGWTSYHQRP